MTDPLVGTLERVVVGSVAVTAKAIGTADAELTLMQWRVLLVVGESDRGVAVGEIATRLGAHASPTSRVLTRLKRRGMVRSTRDALDARVVRISLTDAGRELRSRVIDLRARDLAAVLEDASLAPAEADAVAKLARSFEPYA